MIAPDNGVQALSRELRMLHRESRWLRRLAMLLLVFDLVLGGAYVFARDAMRFWVP